MPAKETNKIIQLDEVNYNKKDPIDYLNDKYIKFKLLETNDDEIIINVKNLIYDEELFLKINRITGELREGGHSGTFFPIGECKRGSFKHSQQKF